MILATIVLILTGCTATTVGSVQTDSCAIKGNINKQGEKIYHLPDCTKYADITVNTKMGERWFCSTAEAETAGWKKSPNCPQ